MKAARPETRLRGEMPGTDRVSRWSDWLNDGELRDTKGGWRETNGGWSEADGG